MTLRSANTSVTASDRDPERGPAPKASGYRYSEAFYRYIESGALRSAKAVIPLVLRELTPVSVLDVGCGAGAWLSEYQNQGISHYCGVDGAYVQSKSLRIPAEHFQSQDISQKFDLGRRFDVVQCLEVGEHIPAASSGTLIENLTRHSDKILFSAATPGQGGENHVNEQPHEFWRLLFARQGFKPFDLFRPMVKGNTLVESWYRRNIILYVAEVSIPALPQAILESAIPDNQAIPEITSVFHKAQSRVVSLLPVWCVSMIALVKHSIVIAYRSLRNI
jgi:SAM-dependent methyltransferase